MASKLKIMVLAFAATLSFATTNVFADDPILGRWRWFDGHIRIFLPGGQGKDLKGQLGYITWTRNNPYETPAKYTIRYKGAKFSDHLTLKAGNTFLDGQNNFNLHVTASRIPDEVQPVTTPASPIPSETPAKSYIDVLADYGASTFTATILSPLDQPIPNCKEAIATLRENLLDEQAKKPAASVDAYRAAWRLCNAWIEAEVERDKMVASFGQAAPATIDTQHGKKTVLNPQDYLMYLRELDDARKKQRADSQSHKWYFGARKNEWSLRCASLREALDKDYAQVRGLLRQGEDAPK